MDLTSIITHIKGETMSKRPPLGKLGLAGKRIRERQLLDREQRERDHRDLKKKPSYLTSIVPKVCSTANFFIALNYRKCSPHRLPPQA